MDPSQEKTDVLLNEFVQLNRRRLFGGPPLSVRELERWQTLRAVLEERVGDRMGSLLASVERRSHLRFRTHLEVRFGTGDELRRAVLTNISQGGLFIATRRPMPVDTPLVLSIQAPEGCVEMGGRVAWVREKDTEDGEPGMGVRFEGVDALQQARIATVVARLAQRTGLD